MVYTSTTVSTRGITPQKIKEAWAPGTRLVPESGMGISQRTLENFAAVLGLEDASYIAPYIGEIITVGVQNEIISPSSRGGYIVEYLFK